MVIRIPIVQWGIPKISSWLQASYGSRSSMLSRPNVMYHVLHTRFQNDGRVVIGMINYGLLESSIESSSPGRPPQP
jgi:hypothetical protein